MGGVPISCAFLAPGHGGHIDFDSRFLKNWYFDICRGVALSVLCMELLLNLAWLLLTLPAWWLWHQSRGTHSRREARSWQCLLTLGCALVILFPVISATDDLCAMRAEQEEPQSSKRVIRQATNDKASLGHNRLPAPPALLGTLFSFSLQAERGSLPLGVFFSLPATLSALPPARAPPVFLLA